MLFMLFIHCLGSSKSLISDKHIFFLIFIQFYVEQRPMVAVNLNIQSTQKWTISLRPSND